jgi:hypothetical protein
MFDYWCWKRFMIGDGLSMYKCAIVEAKAEEMDGNERACENAGR